MILLDHFGLTAHDAVGSTSASWTSTSVYSTFVVYASVGVCLAKGDVNTPGVEATVDDFQLAQGEYVRVKLLKGETLAFICATGESDGVIYITESTQ